MKWIFSVLAIAPKVSYISGGSQIQQAMTDVDDWEQEALDSHGIGANPQTAHIIQLAALRRRSQPYAHHSNFLQRVCRLIDITARFLDLCKALRQPRTLDLHVDLNVVRT